ncbi:PstS family phosphate ABC transporter substrate-binding protein [Haloferacaceae archaeon DSL9]
MSQNSSGRTDRSVSRRRYIAGLGAASAVALAGCIGGDGSGGSDGAEGTIEADGSNTVFPLTDGVAEAFENEYPDVQVNVSGSGTGAGFTAFTQGDTVIQSASRDIDDEEAATAEENGIEYTQFTVGQDGLAIMRHNDNDWADCLTVEELNQIWQLGSDVETWSDVREEWPAEEIVLYGRDTASGTFDYFTEVINGEAGNIRDDYSDTNDTNVIIQGVSGDQYALGFGGVNYYNENEDDLQLVAVDDGDGCFYPTVEEIESGEYTPLTRPLFIFVNDEALEREEVREFARFYFDNAGEIAPDVGFFPATAETYEENLSTLDQLLEERGIED